MTKRTSGVVGGNRRRVSGGRAAPPPTTFSLFTGVSGPAAAASFSGSYGASVCFGVTSAVSLKGYSFWCTNDGDTVARGFVLWQVTNVLTATVIPVTAVTSGPLTRGQWNPTTLSPAYPLVVGDVYLATTAWTAVVGFPLTANQFAAGDPLSGGIVNGPLVAYSDATGSNPVPHNWFPQGQFQTASSDPSGHFPNNAFESSNFWMDVIVG